MKPTIMRIVMRKKEGWEAHNEFGDVGRGTTQNEAIGNCLSIWLNRLSNGHANQTLTPEQEAMWERLKAQNGEIAFETTVHFTPFTDGPICKCPVVVRVTMSSGQYWNSIQWTDAEQNTEGSGVVGEPQ
jgi:hypothetical protein